MWPARCAAGCLVAAALSLAACGGGHGAGRAAAPPAPAAATTPGNGLDPATLPPHHVPQHGTAAADPAAVRVIRGWLRALRQGHMAQAAAYFAIPSRFQNGTPVLTLHTAQQRRFVLGASLPCGAVATSFRRAGRFTLVRFRLTSRVNGDCRGAEGHTTGGAIRVAGGRIREWYRLYDPEELHPGVAPVDPGREKA